MPLPFKVPGEMRNPCEPQLFDYSPVIFPRLKQCPQLLQRSRVQACPTRDSDAIFGIRVIANPHIISDSLWRYYYLHPSHARNLKLSSPAATSSELEPSCPGGQVPGLRRNALGWPVREGMPALQMDKVESPSMRTSRKLKGLNKARATTLRRSSISLQLQAFVLQYGEGQRRQGPVWFSNASYYS